MEEIERVRDAYARRAERRLDERYSLTDPTNLYLFQRRERAILAALKRHRLAPLDGLRILDIGCGSGEMLVDLARYGGTPSLMCGIDLLDERTSRAWQRNQQFAIATGNAAALPYDGSSFDLVLQFTLMSSVLDAGVRAQIAVEALRVLRPGGAILWYDFIWNPTNRDVRGVGLREIRSLYPNCGVHARRVTLAPPLMRRIAPLSWTLCRALETVPFLRSHYLIVIRKPSD